MYETAATSKALRLRRSAARKARVALAATFVAAALVVPPLGAGLVAQSAHAATTTFVVDSTSDQADVKIGDGVCDSTPSGSTEVCTLRAAIQEANNTPGADAITFAVKDAFRDPTTGVATIKPQSALPTITEQVTIDGYTQQGAQENTKAVGDDASLKIELDGTNAGSASGLLIHSPNNLIRGLVINRFLGAGIVVDSANSTGNRIEGNFIGTDPSGILEEGNKFNGVGITSSASQNVIGGTTPDKRNVISGGNQSGVFLAGNANRVEGNYVGTDKSGTKDLGNTSFGVLVDGSSGNTVGGTTAGARNVISGNDFAGVSIQGASDTRVFGNRIGTTAGGTAFQGGGFEGVHLSDGAKDNLVGDGTLAGANTIAFHTDNGVMLEPTAGTGNAISRNSVFSNAVLGIDLNNDGTTPNDTLDVDSGPNGLQNRPSIGSAKTVSGTTAIKGTLSSEATKTYKIEFYSNPSGNEGKKFVGQKSVTTGSDGKGTFTFTPATKVSVGQAITATATNTTTGSPHDTSEFSAPRTVTSS